MAVVSVDPTAAAVTSVSEAASVGFWRDVWRRFRRRKLAMLALVYVGFMSLVAIFAPAIAGTKPVVCKFEGGIYFPCLGYFSHAWENPIFRRDRYQIEGWRYPQILATDPESWVVWPLVYQDPMRRTEADERPGLRDNLVGVEGRPDDQNLFGTDSSGIDVFAQMVHGTTIALLVGFVSTGIAAAIGISLGAAAGYFGRSVDWIVSRVIEIVLCIPPLVLILTLVVWLDRPTIWHVMAVIGFTSWTSIARLARAEFMKLKQADFVVAAEALGASRLRIMFRHILPNALAPLLVPVTFGIAAAILIESSLSFLGVGQDPSTPRWGALLSQSRPTLASQPMWWLVVFPGGAIFLAVLAYNLIGEGLQEATDPRLRGR